jgi:hypothetical protein
MRKANKTEIKTEKKVTRTGTRKISKEKVKINKKPKVGPRGDRTLNQQICNPCVVPYYRLSPYP